MIELYKKIGLFRQFAVMATVLLVFSVSSPDNACAQPATACDPQYMDALESKAWLEVQREITQNKNLIFKPDSVLEYSCFDQLLAHAAKGEEDSFSEDITTFATGGAGGISPTSTDNNIRDTIAGALQVYLENNFEHRYLNERAEAIAIYVPQSGYAGMDYECTQMADVWEAGRCLNFGDGDWNDYFYDFPWYAGSDPRIEMGPIAECAPVAEISDKYLIDAYNADFVELFTLQGGEELADNLADGTEYLKDPILTHICNILPPGFPDCPASCSGSHKVPTGLIVDIPGGATYCECVCTMPSCSYPGGGAPGGDGSSCTCSANCQ